MENFKFIALTDEQLSSASLSKCAHCIVNTTIDENKAKIYFGDDILTGN